MRVDSDQPFTLASGNRSPIYVNCRRAVSDPAFLQLYLASARRLWQSRSFEIDAIAGGETAGIPYAAVLAQAVGKPLVYVRKKPKGYGIGTRVEGYLEPGSRVLLVEDLITDGGSKLGFLDALEEVGATVPEALVLFDRQQGGAELLAGRGARLAAVTDRATAMAVALDAGRLTDVDRLSVEAYFADPAAWHRERGFDFSGS